MSSPRANCKVRTSEKKEIKIYEIKNKKKDNNKKEPKLLTDNNNNNNSNNKYNNIQVKI
jgi:hypothetical protein